MKNSTESSNETLKIIDWGMGTKIVGGDEQLARNLVEMLVDDLPQQELKIEEAMRRNDKEALSQVVHSLHGATCYCGVPQLREAIMRLEISIVKDDNDINDRYATFCNAANNLTEAVEGDESGA